jgi:PAS domain S-box-containing protein
VSTFDLFEGLPPEAELVGHPLWQTLPREIGEPIREGFEGTSSESVKHEVAFDGHVYHLTIHPASEGRGWVRVQDVTSGDWLDPAPRDGVDHGHSQKVAILASALDGIVTVDESGGIVDFNPQVEQILGLKHADVVGRDLANLAIAARDRPMFRGLLAPKAATVQAGLDHGRQQEGPEQVEMRAVHPVSGEFPVALSVIPVHGNGPCAFSICVRDLQERERLETELRQAQKMESLGQLACGVAHDFNNFLTVIRGQGERLERHFDQDEDDRRRKWATSILKMSDRARELTSQLLSFSRPEASTVSVVDLNLNVVGTAGLLRQLLGESIELRLSLADDLWPIKIHANHVEQILFNLAANARDAIAGAGTLEIGTENVTLGADAAKGLHLQPGAHVLLTLTDSGHGMDAVTQSRAFEPFFTTKAEGQGSGIGLSTVYRLVRQCDGQITVSSERERGTTFRIYIPMFERRARRSDRRLGEYDRRNAATAEQRVIASVDTERVLDGVTVLLAEDEREVRRFFREELEAEGCTVLEAGNGAEALRVATAHDGPIDVLISDVVMPEMNGGDFSRELLSRCPGAEVLFVSGYPESALDRYGVRASEHHILHKPISGRELSDHVRRLRVESGHEEVERLAASCGAG